MSMKWIKLGMIGFVAGMLLTTVLILSIPVTSSRADMEVQPADPLEAGAPVNQDVPEETTSPTEVGDLTTADESVAVGETSGDEMKAVPELHHFVATAYCLRGTTASGTRVNPGSVAADPSILPIGSVIRLHAGRYSGVYTVLDTGAKVRGRRLDIWVPTAKEARFFGVRKVKVEVIRHGWHPAESQTSQVSDKN